jgi:hypothetical protein
MMIPETLMVTGDACRLNTFVAGLSQGYAPVAETHNSIKAVDLSPDDLGGAPSLSEERGLTAQLVKGPKRLVTSVGSRLCAWEFDLASEALAKRACCTSCGDRALTPVSVAQAENHSVQFWCAGCTGLRLYKWTWRNIPLSSSAPTASRDFPPTRRRLCGQPSQ